KEEYIVTDVSKDDLGLVHDAGDVISLYRGNGLPECEQRIGMEREIFMYRRGDDGNPVAATAQECLHVANALKSAGHAPQLEIASAIEYASPAFCVTETTPLLREITQALGDYDAAIQAQGLVRNDGAMAP